MHSTHDVPDALTPGENAVEPTPWDEPKRRFSIWQGIIFFIGLTAVLRAVFHFAGGGQDAGRSYIAPATREAPMGTAPQGVLDGVIPPVRYTPAPGTNAGKLEVVYRVYLGTDRKVERVQNWQTSGDPAFDRAVGDALLAAKAFPRNTPRAFQMRYGSSAARKGPWGPLAAVPGFVQAPVRLTQAMLNKHIPAVRYTPTRFAREGTYVVMSRVVLDAQGKVAKVVIVKSSGDVRLDQAVDQALRAAKPFPAGARGFDYSYSATIFHKPGPSEQPADETAPAEPAPATET